VAGHLQGLFDGYVSTLIYVFHQPTQTHMHQSAGNGIVID